MEGFCSPIHTVAQLPWEDSVLLKPLGHWEDIGDVQAEKESKAMSLSFLNTKLCSLYKHHAAVF